MTVEDNLWADTTFRVGARRNDWVWVCSGSVAMKLSVPCIFKTQSAKVIKGEQNGNPSQNHLMCKLCFDCSQCYLQLNLKIFFLAVNPHWNQVIHWSRHKHLKPEKRWWPFRNVPWILSPGWQYNERSNHSTHRKVTRILGSVVINAEIPLIIKCVSL